MKVDPDSFEFKEEKHSIKKMKNFKTIKSSTKFLDKYKLGRLTFATSDLFHVNYQNENILCSLKGTLKKELKQKKSRLACGDFVYFDEKKKSIIALKERETTLMRENPSQKHRNQILATNIDTILITASIKEPLLNPYFIDLYLITAQRSNLTPVIVINKMDLQPADEDEKKLFNEFVNQYKKLDIPIIQMSAKEHKGLEEIKEHMNLKASVFAGQSGVGKSSIINALFDKFSVDTLKTSPVSEKNLKGTHTTTASKLIQLEGGGFCVDTPGVQSLSFKELDIEQIKDYFIEFKDIGCKFCDCLHINEDGCQIKRAVEDHSVSLLRLKSYYRLLEEVKKERK